MPTAIEFNHVSKQYRLGLVSTKTLSHDLDRWWKVNILGKEDPYLKIGDTNDRSIKGESDYVWALKDIDFKVEQGDVVGIIGKNGAGKSTLLKLLSKVTGPTTGTIKARGRIGALLEVGTGFHQEMTGRENIYLNGAILGMSRQEITKKLDEIVDFSGCERYIDTPVKRYSSGMMVRLGFAVAAHLDPEILVVDEVLAVGDAEFQKKAIGKMQDVSRGEGRTVLFVSHNMGSIQQLCNTGVLLENGCVKYIGKTSLTINEYLKVDNKSLQYTCKDPDIREQINLLEAALISSDKDIVYPSSSLSIRLKILINKSVTRLVVGFNIISSFGYPLARADFNDSSDITTLPIGEHEFEFKIPPYTFSTGEYKIELDVAEAGVKNYAPEISCLYFEVVVNENHFGNIYNEVMREKTSIIRSCWLENYY